MTDAFVDSFLANFDNSQFPDAFQRRYEVMECLSTIESGETYLIKERTTGNYFIAKSCPFSKKTFYATERDLLKTAHHKGLPELINEYEDKNTYVIIRSFIPGLPLNEFVSYFKPNAELTLSIAKQLCEILIYLHQQDPPVIHRDIKPHNIIIDRYGQVTLIDFGISRAYKNSAREDTTCLGTRDFAAPEQYGFSQTDCRTDIFSLGILLAWLLTGESELEKARKLLPNNKLGKIVRKCTAFDPNNRYQSAERVLEALSRPPAKHGIILTAIASVALVLGFVLHPALSPILDQQSKSIKFVEPLIEDAVRMILEKETTEIITEEDLLGIENLMIFGNQIVEDNEALQTYTALFVQNDPSIQRGTIQQLDDLLYLKNLRSITLIYQNISDISPLSQLPYLEEVDLRHNPLEDMMPLADAAMLTTLGLFDTKVSDLTALSQCERLATLDLGGTSVQTLAALEGLDALTLLNIRRTSVQTLDGIEDHPLLQEIYLSETGITDFSPLLDLPRLTTVYVGEADRDAIELLGEELSFTVIYE